MNVEISDLRAKSVARAIGYYRRPVFAKPERSAGVLQVMITGGIGDLICTVPVVDQLESLGPVRIYCNHPEAYRYFRPLADVATQPFPGFDYWLRLETVPRFFFEKNFKSLPASVNRLFCWSQLALAGQEILRAVSYQPFMDYELWGALANLGLRRHTVGAHVLGLTEFRRLSHRPEIKVDLEPFVTVHDGYDVTQKFVGYRSTKTWNLRYWAALVRKMKEYLPSYKIVQLGSQMSRPIPGVDVNFAGRLSLSQSFNVLSRSSLHIDGDSGLVHAAAAFGVKSVVMFGSTPSSFFGYEENINLDPRECGGCGWSTPEWMDACPLYDSPKCLDSIGVNDVWEAVNKAL